MKISLFIFVIVLVSGVIAILLFPYQTVNPGVLIEDHMILQKDCLSCHSLGSGAVTEKCLACHKLGEIGLIKVDGTNRNYQNEKSSLLHQAIINIKCFDCHTEHNGLSRENATINFKHSVLNDTLRSKCINCHLTQKPADDLHKNFDLNCSVCHNTDGWKPVNFEHLLLGDFKNNCGSCHGSKKPDDILHNSIGSGVECSQCHTTERWNPSTFNHTKFFRFDENHPSNCGDCHSTEKGFTDYSCYNCHEHRPSRIAKKHRKKGIINFENCSECHRTGDEDDAKQNLR